MHAYRWTTLEHSTVDHSTVEYARDDVSTNQAENYFPQLKRSIDGTEHLRKLVHQVGGRRLTYREPACKDRQDAQ
jgi:hypothetical protein